MAKVIDEQGRAEVHLDGRGDGLGLPSTELVAMYRTMLLTRALDQKSWKLNRSGKAAFAVSGEGHEAVQVGSAWAVQKGHDVVLPYYRDIGVVLTVGMSAYEVLLGVLARPDDPNSGGRQMASHWGCSRLNIISGSSPIATQAPHAVGIALAARMRGEDRVAVCYFGEGAASKGDFHEALNIAGVHQLPVVFVCENNGYAISVPLERQSALADISGHASSYGFPGVTVDGNDPVAVYQATRTAVQRARRGGGPTLVEGKTYRFLPHTSDDDDRYRSRDEIESWRKKDPVPRMQRLLLERGILTEDQDAQLLAEVRTEVDEALHKAQAAAEAQPEMAFTRVYARPLRPVAGVPASVDQHVRPPGPSPRVEGGTTRNVVDTVRHTLREVMAADDRVMVLGEDVGRKGGVFRATNGLHTEFGDDRVFDTPLAESGIVGMGIGLALAGMRPVVEMQFADFLHSAFDQIVSEAAKMHYRSNGDFCVPLVIRAPWGGGIHGALYHSQAVEATYAHVAGLKVVAPSTPADVAGMLREAVDDPDPVLFLEHKKTYRLIKGPVPEGDWRVPLGVADVARPGDDLTIVTYGLHRHLSVEAAEALAEEDYSVEVIDLRTISPLDRDTVLSSARRTGRVLVVHEDNVSFGVGAEVAAMIAAEAFYDLDAPVRRLAMADVPAMPFAKTLETGVSITAQHIADAARSLLEE